MVSGASRGLGFAIARRLHADGFRLSLGVRDPARTRVRLALPPDGGVLIERFDATEPASAGRWVDATLSRFGRLDGLVNNAGILRQVTFDEGAEEVLDELWQVNVKGPFRLLRLTLPHLRASATAGLCYRVHRCQALPRPVGVDRVRDGEARAARSKPRCEIRGLGAGRPG